MELGISGNSYVFNAEMKPMVLKPFVLIEFRERERALLSLGNLIDLQPFNHNVWLRQKKNLTLRKLCGIVSVFKNLTIIFRLTYFSLLKYVFVFIETVVYLYICYTWLGIISTRRAHVY